MDIRKTIDDQELDEEEKRGVVEWLERIADGRLIVRVPVEAFRVPTHDRGKIRELCEKVKRKPAGRMLIRRPD